MKRLKRLCKVCDHPKHNHVKSMTHPDRPKCNNCSVLMMYHAFELDNLKYLEEVHEKKLP